MKEKKINIDKIIEDMEKAYHDKFDKFLKKILNEGVKKNC